MVTSSLGLVLGFNGSPSTPAGTTDPSDSLGTSLVLFSRFYQDRPMAGPLMPT
jgi:hypothetical protein